MLIIVLERSENIQNERSKKCKHVS